MMHIFKADHPGPSLIGKQHLLGEKAFTIKATHSITRQK
jgi:hypothetical protein